MRVQLANCTQTLLNEIASRDFNQKSVAMTYALALRSSETTDWPTVNNAIIERWSRSGLNRIKEWAWSGKCFEPPTQFTIYKGGNLDLSHRQPKRRRG